MESPPRPLRVAQRYYVSVSLQQICFKKNNWGHIYASTQYQYFGNHKATCIAAEGVVLPSSFARVRFVNCIRLNNVSDFTL